jgi:hypothetical protein
MREDSRNFRKERKQLSEEEREEEPGVHGEVIMQRSDEIFICEYVLNDFPNQIRFNLTERQTLEPGSASWTCSSSE